MKEVYTAGKVKKPVRKIVSLAPSLTEILFYLRLEDRVIGVTEQCDYPEEAKSIEKIGSFSTADVEKIRRLEPDIVIDLEGIHLGTTNTLKEYGIPVLVLNSKTVAGVFKGMDEIAKIAGVKDRKALINPLKDRVRRVEESTRKSSRPGTLRLMCLEPLVTVPSLSSYKSDAIRIAGGAPMPVESEYEYPFIQLVDILVYNPEVILMCGRQSEEETKEMCLGCNAKDPPCQWTRAMMINDSVLSDTIAAKMGKVYITPCECLCRPGPRLVDGIEYLAKLFRYGTA